MLRTRHLFIFIILALSLSACGKQEGEEYFPNPSMVSKWNYKVKYILPTGVENGKMSIKAGGTEVIRGKTYYKLVTQISGGPSEQVQISYNRRAKEGIYRIDSKHKDKPEYILTPFPIVTGSTWTLKTPEGSRKYQAERKETIDISGKKYKDCLKVVFQGNKGSMSFDGVSYLAPGVGEVKTVLNMENITIVYTLDNYIL